ncbi:S1 family peptidase [Streptomyces sp. NPDC057675]|uniref:S1 family peptidase n=1 Tax=Streptomyces sp. NPDC057675 TaxID=3346204 RepID=UPI0036C77B14
MSANSRFFSAGIGALSIAAFLTAVNFPASANAKEGPEPSEYQKAAVSSWVKKGLSEADALKRLESEVRSERTAREVEDEFGDHIAGMWLEDDGSLTVSTVDEKTRESLELRGVRTAVAKNKLSDLKAIQAELDSFARAEGAGSGQSWYVDEKRNQVTVEKRKGGLDRLGTEFIRKAQSFGPAVNVIESPGGELQPAFNVRGGDRLDYPGSQGCSLGFNARDAWGFDYVITAGHCGSSANWTTYGSALGSTATMSYPGNDYQTIVNLYPWNNAPTAQVWNYSSGVGLTVKGSSYALTGRTLCKSGWKTGFTCGQVLEHNASYDLGGGWVGGLVKHSACVEAGDSGGSNIVNDGTVTSPKWMAQGVTTAGQYYLDPVWGEKVCGEKVGMPNVGYHQPIGEVLSNTGLTLRTG